MKRQWIGIDITHLAINLMKTRLLHSFGEKSEIEKGATSIINKEGKDTTYILNLSSGGESHTRKALVRDGRIYRHIFHVYPETVKEGKVNLAIYKEGDATPLEKTTYYIRFD